LNPAIEKLSKYLELEAARGYDNKAVMGGLQKMLEPWKAEAEQHGVPEELRALVVARLRDYPQLSANSRAEALEGLWRRLRQTYPELKANGEQAPPTEDREAVEKEPAEKDDRVEPGEVGPAAVEEEDAPAEVAEAAETGPAAAAEEAPGVVAEAAEAELAVIEDEEAGEGIEAGPVAAAEDDETEPVDAQEEEKAKPIPEEQAAGDQPVAAEDDGKADAAAAKAEEVAEAPSAEVADSAQPTEVKAEAADQEPASLDASLTSVPGIGPKSAKTLKKLDLETLGDLLWHLPRRYDDYSQLKTINRLWYGEEVTIIGTVEEISVRTVRGGKMKLVEATVSDGTGGIRVTWFNQTWIASRLKAGKAVVLSGTIEQYLGRLTMNSPEWEPLDREQVHTNRIVPVYPLTAGITAKWLRRVINAVVMSHAARVPDPLPDSILTQANLMPFGSALRQVHFPDGWDQLKRAQDRLAFDEMLFLQLGVLRQKQGWQQLDGEALEVEDAWNSAFKEQLPYQLTEDQEQALVQVRQSLASERPMNRLLQGDVGSGKTVIAAAAIGITAANGAQTALMAPTSILAEQHYATISSLLPELPADQIALLLGSTPAADKERIRQGLAGGEILVVVGTHALLEDPVGFAQLGLAIIDEQHRFGVSQRASLRDKGASPHLLVMTATPIPRSLALTLYGDLDLTIIEEMPPDRQVIETKVMRPLERSRAHSFIRGQLRDSRQAFIIYPLVEGSDKVQAKAAVDEHQRLQESVFPEYRLGLLHGRLKADQKEAVMSAFRAGEYDALVSTSVVEVGVDIPNATTILIEGANRFGLAQLHQFRGRVGRGEHKSYCLLIPDREDEAENERLLAMESTTDGFELAELDLEQRGPGEFLGTRQSGFTELRAARLTDIRLIEKARSYATRLFDQDPGLEAPEHHSLARAVDRFWMNGKGEIS
jgi:ATP-dependent DNA helicase RecG